MITAKSQGNNRKFIDVGARRFTSANALRSFVLKSAESAAVIVLTGVPVGGKIDLSDLRAPAGGPLPPLELINCVCDEANFSGSSFVRILLEGCRISQLIAIDAKVDGTLKILDLDGAKDQGCWINLSGIRVESDVRVSNIRVAQRTRIGGYTATECAFFMQSADIHGNLVMMNIKADGIVGLNGAQIGGSLSIYKLAGGNGDGLALNAESMSVQGTFSIMASDIHGYITLQNAFVDGTFNATEIVIHGANGVALRAEGACIRGAFVLFRALLEKGGLSLLAAEIDGIVDLDGSTIDISQGNGFSPQNVEAALDMETAKIGGHLYMRRNMKIVGAVLASTSTFGGSIDIANAEISSHNGPQALWLVNTEVKGNLSIGSSAIVGTVDIATCEIGGSLFLRAVDFKPEDGGSLGRVRLDDSTISRTLGLSELTGQLAEFSLSGLTCASFDDAGTLAWRKLKADINFDGFSYARIDGYGGPSDAPNRIGLLLRSLDSAKRYRPQPFKALAHVLDAYGDADGARRCLSEKRRCEMRYQERRLTRPFSWVFGALFDYGLSVRRAITTVSFSLLISLLLVLAADGPAKVLKHQPGDHPVAESCSEVVDPFWFTIDLFIPIIDLRAAGKCTIVPAEGEFKHQFAGPYEISSARVWRFIFGLIEFSGWIMMSGLVLTLSGALRRT